jgi:cell wall-associated NlpC family hydrolase
VRGVRGTRGKVRDRPGGRASLRVVVGCGLLMALTPRGDLLFYATNTSDPSTIHHVAIYIGNGMMVNAPFTGAFVRIDSMYQPGGLIGAVRPAG